MNSPRNNFNAKSTNQPLKTRRTKDKTSVKDKSINMLSVAISTVMLMSSRVPNIPDEYYVWTDRYLKCIRDGHGQHPPNVKKILKMIGKSTEETVSLKEDENKCKCPQVTPPFRVPE